MSHEKTLLACISGQDVSLEPTQRGADLQRMLAEASEKLPPHRGITLLRVNRNGLVHLAERSLSPPKFRIKVNGNPTTLNIPIYSLISDSIIIAKVEGKKIKMHGIEDGREPRDGNDPDWERIEVDGYAWNLGTGTINI